MSKENKFNSFDKSFLENLFTALPANVFFKGTDLKYQFCTQYWKNINVDDDDPNWTIAGKTDYDIRKDIENVPAAMEADRRIIETGIGENYTIKVINDDKSITYMELSKNPVFDANGKVIGIIGLIQDVTNKIELEEIEKEKQRMDSMTHVYNRNYYEYFMEYESKNLINPLTIISVDINALKYINDTFGHQAGDDYIKKSAKILKAFMPSNAKIFRTGGDEFVVFIEQASTFKVCDFIDDIKTACKSIFVEGFPVSLSIGYTTSYEYVEDVKALLKEADEFMYRDKERFYTNNDIKKRIL